MGQIPALTPEQLYQKIASGEKVFVFDVRNRDEYNDWKIEGKELQSVNVPYFEIIEDEDNEVHYENLPKDAKIVVVCAKGGASEYIAEILQAKGFDVSHLEGGLLAWSEFYYPTMVAFDEKMKLFQINRYAKGCLSYMIISSGEAAVVDPGRQIQVYMDLAKKEGVKITRILDSHLHADHISGGTELAKRTGATYYLNSSEGAQVPFEPLEKHEKIKFGRVELEVLAIKTPGHTPGSVSFLVNNKFLLSGDTIFVGGLGRPDLGGKAHEWALDLYDTVFNKIRNLADDVMVLPAHFADIQEMNDHGIVGETLGNIRKSNEQMQMADKEEFTKMVATSAESSTKPPNFEDIVAINRGVKRVDADEATELEIGPNRCAVHHTS
ncbi:MBL fold metallo-hydrolase [Microaerobacter geothermalis]|uniref:MBL fold metallo-hydrolase n=1 Tax=Microaerobacter geothermalis TaxID=674972 RepID=UPI001F1C5169|nr:MBL fold metallo-hydrolase [Microaerobacter geothermalis]MCF6093587.1 MBL fold metallo-hydrolase [Microaerobacter geothermalis]